MDEPQPVDGPKPRWRDGSTLRELFDGRGDEDWPADRAGFDQSVRDPFEAQTATGSDREP